MRNTLSGYLNKNQTGLMRMTSVGPVFTAISSLAKRDARGYLNGGCTYGYEAGDSYRRREGPECG